MEYHPSAPSRDRAGSLRLLRRDYQRRRCRRQRAPVDEWFKLLNYTLTGGRIVGAGAKVKWDLTGVRPGTYTITAGVDDGCGLCGATMTKTVVVR